ncbi:vitamin B12 dependent-methionine synthase activation domain-containing protein [Chloroflexota bacterium]
MHITVRPTDILVQRQQLLSRLGYNSISQFKLTTFLERALFIASILAKPEAVYIERNIIGRSDNSMNITGKHVFKTTNIGQYINSCCSRLIIFVATIGNRLENEVSRMLGSGDTLTAFFLNAAGSQYMENFAEYITNYITAQQPNGIITTNRYSPGYCDWKITDQVTIFKLLEPKKLCVTLNEKCLMEPLKSISGIMGVGKEAVIASTPMPCQTCQKYNCSHRINNQNRKIKEG